MARSTRSIRSIRSIRSTWSSRSNRPLWQRPLAVPAVLASVTSFAATLALLAPPSGAATVSGTYHAIAPVRVLDTRSGNGAATGPVAHGATLTLTLAGAGQLPAAGTFSAVMMSVTVTGPTAPGYLTVYPDGQAAPNTSNLNFLAGQTIANSVFERVPSDGKIGLYNAGRGSVQLVVDVRGYYTGTDAPSGRGMTGALPSPSRVLDTRSGSAVAPHASVSVVVTGRGVPTDASAVILNLAAVTPTRNGNITAYPAGHALPNTSNVNFVAGQTIPNLVVVPVGDGGKVSFENSSLGTVQVLADIFGYVTAGLPSVAGGFNTLPPARLLDTRSGVGGYNTPFAALDTRTVSVAGRMGVPLSDVGSVVVNVTVVAPSRAGYLTVYSGGTRPLVSNLDFAAGQTIANLAVTAVGGGAITIFNGAPGTAHVLVDVAGYVPSVNRPVPTVTSISRYVPNLVGGSSTADATTMHSEGCADATAGSTYVLLDIGAQSQNTSTTDAGDVLGPNDPGVALTESSPTVRLTYPHLVAALNGYTAGFVSCTTSAAKILIGTNSDGDFTSYTAQAKGQDWADKVVDLLTAHGPQLTIAGADDIEAGFAATEAQASLWEQSFLASTTADLVYNGSLDNCPIAFGSTADCGLVAGQSTAWTRADYVTLTHTNGASRISVLPQVYVDSQAGQWANVDATAAGAITFDGVLTQVGVCGTACSNDSAQGWTALYAAISTVVTTPNIPTMTDLVVS